MMQVTGHVGEGEAGVPVDGDVRRVPVLSHAYGARIMDRIVRHLVRRALSADETYAPITASLSAIMCSYASLLKEGKERKGPQHTCLSELSDVPDIVRFD